jgi:ankyrin repeat protein
LSLLDDEYGVAIDCYDTVAICSIPNYEKKDISRSLTDIASLLILLSRYVSVTHAAADRISTKIARILDEIECLKSILQKASVQWAQSLHSINSLLRTLHVARPYTERGTSSLLTRHETAKCLGHLDNAVTALQQDSISQLEECLRDGAAEKSDYYRQTTLLILSKIGILCSASNCLPFLLSRFSTDHDLGQHGLLNPLRVQTLHAARLKDENHAHQSVRLVLDSLPPVHWPAVLLSPDSLGRVALHYAAFHGITTACNEMIQCILSLDLSKAAENIPIFLVKDKLGETPFSIAIAQGHDEVLKSFLNWLHPSGAQVFGYGTSELKGVFQGMVSLAIRSQRPHVTELLIDHDPQLVATCSKASELLYLASQFGHTSLVERLLKHTNNINIGERLRRRTPLMIATIYEHIDVVKLLLSHPSCDVSVRDRDGWTAVTHAAFKGTPALVNLLQDHGGCLGTPPILAKPQSSIKLPANRLDRQNQGSDVARDYSHVFINFGHFDMEKESVILQIEAFRRLVAPMYVPESSLTIEVSAVDGSVPEKYQLALPILEDLSNDPLVFSAKNPHSMKLMFRVYCSVLPHKAHEPSAQLIGSALVSLGDAHKTLGPSLESLERDHTVSLISPDAFGNEYIGSLTFTFVISEPFVFKGSPPTPTSMVLKRNASSPLVAGHRGKKYVVADNSFLILLIFLLKPNELTGTRPRPEFCRSGSLTVGRKYHGCTRQLLFY